MMEWWRRRTYNRFTRKKGASDEFGEFEEWASGPWTPSIAAKIPLPELLVGPPLGTIDAQTRQIIDIEVARRYRSISPAIANVISALALFVAIMALLHDNGC
jgi:hypothetical protein